MYFESIINGEMHKIRIIGILGQIPFDYRHDRHAFVCKKKKKQNKVITFL